MTGAPQPLARFAGAVSALLDADLPEAGLLGEGGRLLAALVATDGWLPDAFARPGPERYRQYLLHRDPQERFSVVSFVWGPGQSTPVHDHTVWGLVGVLRGAEVSQRFRIADDGGPIPDGPAQRLEQGAVEAVSPKVGDVHQVFNAFDDQVSVSIHVYGADIGATRRWVYPLSGGRKPFVSGYDNDEASAPFVLELEEHVV